MRDRKSTRVALGGIAAGISLVMMFLTGMIPFSYYALPALAGLVLIAVEVEMGRGTALVVYVAVALLSLFVVPDKEAAILFIFFFGYYPIVKTLLDRIRPKAISFVVKLLVFNVSVIAGYLVVVNVLGLTEILDEFGSFGQYSVWVLLALGNVFFLLYDFCVGNVYFLYTEHFRTKFLGKK